MRRFLAVILLITIWFSFVPTASAVQTSYLVPCKKSPAFLERMKNARDTYYFEKPNKAYAEYLVCGEEGLPHLPISVERAVDIAIPFGIFFYFAGFVGWSGRAYLQAANKSKTPELMEIFIDIPLAIQSFFKGLLWPLLAFQELVTGQLTARDNEIPVSPR
jgi:photosystem I subunit III